MTYSFPPVSYLVSQLLDVVCVIHCDHRSHWGDDIWTAGMKSLCRCFSVVCSVEPLHYQIYITLPVDAFNDVVIVNGSPWWLQSFGNHPEIFSSTHWLLLLQLVLLTISSSHSFICNIPRHNYFLIITQKTFNLIWKCCLTKMCFTLRSYWVLCWAVLWKQHHFLRYSIIQFFICLIDPQQPKWGLLWKLLTSSKFPCFCECCCHGDPMDASGP